MSSSISGLGSIGNISELPKLSALAASECRWRFQRSSKECAATGEPTERRRRTADWQSPEGRQRGYEQVMIAVEKADVAFQLMMQVRNKIVSAYQDIEKMQF